jgi:Ca-activated chloride channel family protein
MRIFFTLFTYISLLQVQTTYGLSIPEQWKYSTAAHDAQKGKWQEASENINQLLINHYDRADILYDAGVAAYHNERFAVALTHFDRALQKTQDKTLQERIHFNKGNTHVALKELPQAIQDYQTVLSSNPDNKQARHNLEIVKKMLEQQKQKQQDQDEKNKDNSKDDKKEDQNNTQQGGSDGSNKKDTQDNKQDRKSSENNQDQKKQDEGNREKKESQDGQDKRSENKQPQDSGSSESQRDNEQQDQQDNQSSEQKQDGPSSEKQKSDQSESGKRDNNKDNKAETDDNKSEQQEQHDKERDQNDQQKKDESNRDLKREQSQKAIEKDAQSVQATVSEQPLKPVERKDATSQFGEREQWMVKVLQAQEGADKKAQKQVIKSTVNKKLGEQHGNNCW